MKKTYTLLYLLNILAGICLVINYLFVFNNTSISPLIFIIILLFYIASIIYYFKRKKEVSYLDVIITTIYVLFITIVFIFSINYQANNPETFNMMYFSRLLILPHVIYIIYNLIK